MYDNPEDYYGQMNWQNAFVTGWTCEFCNKVIKSHNCICVSVRSGKFFHFHKKCAKEICRLLEIKPAWEDRITP